MKILGRHAFIWLTGRAPRTLPPPPPPTGYITFTTPPPALWTMQFTTHPAPQMLVYSEVAPNAAHRLTQRLLLGIVYKRLPENKP